ncbi:MAG TPA: glycosyltransferase family protein [Xanthobacteraceae bacterium]|nr:glycosyltransferase family protein [Xanthobacteraceae bacterium]
MQAVPSFKGHQRVVAAIQARMTSTRLPGKVMVDLCGAPLLQRIVERLRLCRNLDAIVIATTVNREDDPVDALGRTLGVPVFRGDENDVLGRMLAAAESAAADVVVRITADCPVIDPGVVDECIALRDERGVDYASNVIVRTYPDGLDTEVMTIDALRTAAAEAHDARQREHVTLYIRGVEPGKPAGQFSRADLTFCADLSHLRWTVDRQDDLDRIREIYAAFQRPFGWLEILTLATRRPHLLGVTPS